MSNQPAAEGDFLANRTASRVSQQELDQLAEGELGPSERRRLLAALDEEPDGWRRCTLAFLETQSWRQACRQLAAKSDGPGGVTSRPLSRHHQRRATATIAAAAA